MRPTSTWGIESDGARASMMHRGGLAKPDDHVLEVARAFANVLELHVCVHNLAVREVRLHVHDVAADAGTNVALRGQHQLQSFV